MKKFIYVAILWLISSTINAQVQINGRYTNAFQSKFDCVSKDDLIRSIPRSAQIEMPPIDVHNMDQVQRQIEQQEESDNVRKGYKFAHAEEVFISMETHGTWSREETSVARVWTLMIQVPNALSLSLVFSRFRLPPGGELYLVGSNVKMGAFTGLRNNKKSMKFATAPVEGDYVVLEYWEPDVVGCRLKCDELPTEAEREECYKICDIPYEDTEEYSMIGCHQDCNRRAADDGPDFELDCKECSINSRQQVPLYSKEAVSDVDQISDTSTSCDQDQRTISGATGSFTKQLIAQQPIPIEEQVEPMMGEQMEQEERMETVNVQRAILEISAVVAGFRRLSPRRSIVHKSKTSECSPRTRSSSSDEEEEDLLQECSSEEDKCYRKLAKDLSNLSINQDLKGSCQVSCLEESPFDDTAHGHHRLGRSGGCHYDVACPEGDAVRNEIRSVGLLLADDNQRVCTGSLLNNASGNGRQLFLTAEHCLSQRETSNYLVLFNYQRLKCYMNRELMEDALLNKQEAAQGKVEKVTSRRIQDAVYESNSMTLNEHVNIIEERTQDGKDSGRPLDPNPIDQCVTDASKDAAEMNSAQEDWMHSKDQEAMTSGMLMKDSAQGLEVLVSHRGADAALMEILEIIPPSYSVYLSGWRSVAEPVPENVVCVHHPMGDYKMLSQLDGPIRTMQHVTATAGSPNGHYWWVRQWTLGVTELGSSGGPLYDGNGELVGHLIGGRSSCIFPKLDDSFCSLYSVWDLFKPYLDPLGSGSTRIGGMNLHAEDNTQSPDIHE